MSTIKTILWNSLCINVSHLNYGLLAVSTALATTMQYSTLPYLTTLLGAPYLLANCTARPTNFKEKTKKKLTITTESNKTNNKTSKNVIIAKPFPHENYKSHKL